MPPNIGSKNNDLSQIHLQSNSARSQIKENLKPSLQKEKDIGHFVKVKVQQRTEESLNRKRFDSPNIPGFKPIISNR